MKSDYRNPNPVLSGKKLGFFYSILTLWESSAEKKVVNNFKSTEIKSFLNKRDSRNVTILSVQTDRNNKRKLSCNCRYTLYVKDTKDNIGLSLLYHLRNAFAHNDIKLSDCGNIIHITHIYKGTLKLKTTIPFGVLKELIETIRGQHQLSAK